MREMDEFCRTCMCQFPKKAMDKIECYDIFQIPNLADKLRQCTNLSVTLFDEYPRLLCGKCFEKIKDFYEFKRMCKESLNTFKDVLMIDQNDSCENFTRTTSAENTSSKKECHDWEVPLNIDHSIEFEIGDLIIEDDGSEFESQDYEVLLMNQPDNTDKLNGVAHTTQTPVEAEHMQDSVLPKRIGNDDDAFLEDPNESEEECVVDTLSEDDDESHLEPQDYVQALDFNPTSILKYPFHCDLCPKVFRYKHRLTAHIRRHQGLGAYPCNRNNCTQTYTRLCDLRQHLREHVGFPREIFKCDVDNCGKEYTKKSAINAHMRKQHNFGTAQGTRKYVCDICGAVLANPRSLQDHHFVHVDKCHWPFGCDVKGCSSRFQKVSHLKEHKNRHAGIKPYVCPHCDKRFFTSSNLSVHVNYHTQEKKWSCHACAKVFLTPANLRLHVQKEHEPGHIGARFPCRMCEKTLSTHTARKYHEMRHKGEKPYVCEECGRGFTQPSGLKSHKRIHVEMERRKDYVCHICDRAFTSSVSLKHHELKHTGEKPYKCEKCGIKFRYPTSLSRHRTHNLCKTINTTNVREEVDDVEISVVDLDGQYELELS